MDRIGRCLRVKYNEGQKSILAQFDVNSVDDLKKVIDSKSQEWLSSKEMAQYLRPSTLFQAGKFQGYLLSAKPLISSLSNS